jgi:hypothetical protein
MYMLAPDFSFGRLVDVWKGGTDRDPAAVVAEHRNRAPAWLRKQIRPLTVVEQKLWHYLGDPSWMRTAVFSQVPVHIPEMNRGYVFGFLVPARAVAIEIVPGKFGDTLARLARDMEQDELVREKAGIATMRCFEAHILGDVKASAEHIRWDLGLGEKGDDDIHGINVPR